jgi:hypothetical protein
LRAGKTGDAAAEEWKVLEDEGMGKAVGEAGRAALEAVVEAGALSVAAAVASDARSRRFTYCRAERINWHRAK